MTVRDVVQGTLTLAPGATGYIQPPTDLSWLIQNISCEKGLLSDSYQLFFVRDSDKFTMLCLTENVTTTGFLNNLILHCTSTLYFGITNTSEETLEFVYNGVVSNDGTNGVTLVNEFTTVGAGANLNIQPPVGQEWQINAIMGTGPSMNVSWNGSGALIAATSATGWIPGLRIGVNNTNYILVENNSSAAHNFGFIGVRTK